MRLIGFGVLAALVAAGLAALGFWQLDRAQAKIDLLTGIERAMNAPLVPLAQAEALPSGPRFRAVVVQGRFDPEREILLDNQLRQGQAGVRAYVPFLIDGDRRALLVDRGWLAWPDRSAPPPRATADLGGTRVEGMLVDLPGAALRLAADVDAGWPLLVTAVEHDALEHRLAVPLLDFVLEDRGARSAESIRAGMLPPERHRGYAVQWFGLSIAVLVIYLILAWRELRRAKAVTPNEPK